MYFLTHSSRPQLMMLVIVCLFVNLTTSTQYQKTINNLLPTNLCCTFINKNPFYYITSLHKEGNTKTFFSADQEQPHSCWWIIDILMKKAFDFVLSSLRKISEWVYVVKRFIIFRPLFSLFLFTFQTTKYFSTTHCEHIHEK